MPADSAASVGTGVLAVIPARGGTKGLPGKNVRLLDGIPLIGHVARAARMAAEPLDLLLSTDDPAIAEIGGELGLEVPFLRPAVLATDRASSAEVAVHALEFAENRRGAPYHTLVLLQPTCPFTRPQTIDQALSLIRTGRFDFVGTAVEVIDQHPAYLLRHLDCGRFVPAYPALYGILQRQDLPALYYRSGNVYAVRRDCLVTTRKLIQDKASFVAVDRIEAVNINDAFDWSLAEAVIATRNRVDP